MEKIREDIQNNLTTAEHTYDAAFNLYTERNEKLKEVIYQVNRHKLDMECAKKDMIYYMELLNELDGNEK